MATKPLPTVTAFDWVPDFAKGLVRDLRVRWALEEVGAPYATEKFGAATPRPEDYVKWQPFEQVPAFRDGDLEIFESGAILLYLAEQHPALLPAEPQARWKAIAWLFAARSAITCMRRREARRPAISAAARNSSTVATPRGAAMTKVKRGSSGALMSFSSVGSALSRGGGSGNSTCEFPDPAISMSIAVTDAFSAFHNALIRSA